MKEKIAGVNSIMEALRGKRKVQKILIQEGRGGKRIDDMVKLAESKGVFVQYVEKQRLDKMMRGINHQGIVAQVEEFSYSTIEEVLELAAMKGEQPFILILDGIEDPHNLGAIIRTAECAGVHGVVVPKHSQAEINSTVVKSSAGAVEHMLIVQEVNLVRLIDFLKKNGLWVIGADMEADRYYFADPLPCPAALVIGGEGRGIRRLVKENCDVLVKIPLQGSIESLNASVAAGLVIYELLRQRIIDA